ncbi:MAG: hypothetical protein IJH04_04285 [Eggerthellaceae bacterium]|nr:hypothetical protein [Eggerthellaceae bacterium]
MSTKMKVSRVVASAALAVAMMLSCAGLAFADTVKVWGIQDLFSESELAQDEVKVSVVDFSGEPGTVVFLTVRDGGKTVAQFLPHRLGETLVDPNASSSVVDAFELSVPTNALDEKLADGAYTVEVMDSRAGTNVLFSGSIHGAWARLEGVDDARLLGAYASAGSETFAFTAPDVLYVGDKAYSLKGKTPESTNGSLYFDYEAIDENTAIDCFVKYVDEEGNLIDSVVESKVPYGSSRTVDIPAVIEANGMMYRTLGFSDSVTLANPGSTIAVVSCAVLSEADAPSYMAIIRMVDGDGNVVASDSVNVTGPFAYTVPSVIYKNMNIDGTMRAVGYDLAAGQEAVLNLDPNKDQSLVTNGTRTIEVPYVRQALDPIQVNVVFNLVNGQVRARDGEAGRNLGTKNVTVDETNPRAIPDEQITVDGATYNLAGSVDLYAYEFGSGAAPSVNVYYVPEGYVAPGPYDVTVNYVDIATNQVVKSESVQSLPDAVEDLAIEGPEQFTQQGVTYVRLAGQEEPILHNYYAGAADGEFTYTIYYRDANNELASDVVITRTRVVYVDVPVTTTTTTGTAGTGTAATAVGGTTGAAAGAGAGTGAAAGTTAGNAGTATGQLDQSGTYNVADGEGNGTMTNEAGQDSNAERIAENEVALAEGADGSAKDAAGSGLPDWVLPVGISVPLLALIIALIVVTLRRRAEK